MKNERYKILIVDDDIDLLDSLSELLSAAGYQICSFSSANDALEAFIASNDIQVVITDVRMPGVDGIKLLELLHDADRGIPVILMTAYSEIQVVTDALRKGAFDLLFKPFKLEQVMSSVNKAIRQYELLQIEKNYRVYLEKTVEIRTADLTRSLDNLRKAFDGAIQAMALVVEARDPYTSGHQRRTANLARAIADEMKLPGKIIDGIRMTGVIHDVGKISVPTEILSKPGKLSEIEYSLIKSHPETGYRILKEIEFPWPVAEIIRQHHERINGSGYPEGLSEDQILIEARFLAVADVVEAMASHRPYRPARGIDVALEEISEKRGILYAADVTDACLRLFREGRFDFAHPTYRPLSQY